MPDPKAELLHYAMKDTPKGHYSGDFYIRKQIINTTNKNSNIHFAYTISLIIIITTGVGPSITCIFHIQVQS